MSFPKLSGLSIIKEKYRTKNSVIYLARNDESDKITILKAIQKNSLSQKSYEMLKRERDFYSSNISPDLFPSFIKPYKDENNLYIEMTFIEGVNFSKLLTDEHILIFSEKEKSNFKLYLNLVSQIIYIINLLHINNYCYRDLKLNNLIINKELKISLIDFGFVKKLENREDKTSTVCGTFHMKAPEIFMASEGKLKEYNPFSFDVYSIGVIMYEIYYGKAPFNYYKDDLDMEEYKKILYKGIDESKFEENIDKDLKELIIRCMNVDPEKRPKTEEIVTDKLWEKFGGFEKLRGLNNELALLKSDKQIKDFIEYIQFSGDFSEDYEFSEDKKKMDDLFANF